MAAAEREILLRCAGPLTAGRQAEGPPQPRRRRRGPAARRRLQPPRPRLGGDPGRLDGSAGMPAANATGGGPARTGAGAPRPAFATARPARSCSPAFRRTPIRFRGRAAASRAAATASLPTYALLNHGGDFKAAAKRAGRAGLWRADAQGDAKPARRAPRNWTDCPTCWPTAAPRPCSRTGRLLRAGPLCGRRPRRLRRPHGRPQGARSPSATSTPRSSPFRREQARERPAVLLAEAGYRVEGGRLCRERATPGRRDGPCPAVQLHGADHRGRRARRRGGANGPVHRGRRAGRRPRAAARASGRGRLRRAWAG